MCHRATQCTERSCWACALEPGIWNCGAQELGALEPLPTREVTERRSLHNAMQGSPCSLQLDKSLWSNKDTAQPKINNLKEWLLSKSLKTINAGEGVEKREYSYTWMGMQTNTATIENSVEIPLKNSKPVHWDNPEGWDGEGDGRGLQDGGDMYTHGWFMSMYGKNHCNIVK